MDTDIGTDVDDLLALVFLAHARELSLKRVTTVYGDTLLRAGIAVIALSSTGSEGPRTDPQITRSKGVFAMA